MVREDVNKNRKIWGIKMKLKKESHFQLWNFTTDGVLSIFPNWLNSYLLSQIHAD